MSPRLISILAGVVLITLWGIGLKKGLMPSLGKGTNRSTWHQREIEPVMFWIEAAVFGSLASAVLVVSILR
jgi:hypothetical protein